MPKYRIPYKRRAVEYGHIDLYADSLSDALSKATELLMDDDDPVEFEAGETWWDAWERDGPAVPL